MVKKKIDNRIRVMIENGVKIGHRSLFVIIGDKARDQVPILYDILTKSSVKTRPTVLWCYKTKDEAISSHGKKRSKKIQAGKIDINEEDIFDTFRISTTIHGRFYSETHSILGRTYGVCVLQDFEAITPNLIARTFETVEGGGLIILLLKTIQSLKQLFTMSMDVHKRFRTESHQTVTCRFNERLILSLADCKRCLVVNEDLSVLPLSSKTIEVIPSNSTSLKNMENDFLLQELKTNLKETPPAGPLINICKTYDQANAVVKFIEALAEKNLKPPTSLTAARGRGKSAALGLSVAAAIYFGYVNIYVTSPHPENLITLFEFVLKGFDILEYQEHSDYTIIRSSNTDYKKCIIRLNVFRQNRQTIQYISPNDTHLLNAADLLVVDEAAAIPLSLIKNMLGPYLIFMASTINGYEGTGRSLSLKLLNKMQKENKASPPIQLEESIRYSMNDDVENWLSSLLCLDVSKVINLNSGCPSPEQCELYFIDRDALFSYHKAAELFLHRLVSIYVSSHYKNSPNDLQMMSDAPAHNIFCLLGPIKKKDQLPEILVVIQTSLEGKISADSINASFSRGKTAAGDLIPWIISEQFADKNFPKLPGLRIVRIATHPNYQNMGYGKRALKLLRDYYERKFSNLNENVEVTENEYGIEEVEENNIGLLKEVVSPRKKIPTLLRRLSERNPENIQYIGTSFGLTRQLLKFWKSQQFVPVYLSQKSNDITGEQSCIMLLVLQKEELQQKKNDKWICLYFNDFKRRIIKLLHNVFKDIPTNLALSLLDNKSVNIETKALDTIAIDVLFLQHDIQRLESYSRNQVDYRIVADLISDLALLFFQGKLQNIQIDALQKAILLGIGLQGKSIDNLSQELNIPSSQMLAKFHDSIKKITKYLLNIIEKNIETKMIEQNTLDKGENLNPLKETLNEEFEKNSKIISIAQREELKNLQNEQLQDFLIKGTDEDWSSALANQQKGLVSVKSGTKRLDDHSYEDEPQITKKSKKKKNKTLLNP